MNAFKEVIRLILPSVLISILLYIFLHELGHVIVLWSVDAKITELSIISAHVNYNGRNWTDLSDKWMHLNGVLFPLLVSVLYIMLYRTENANRYYRVISGFFVLMPISSLLAWVFIPILYMLGQAPEGDDVYKFLYNFCYDYPAFLVSICAFTTICCTIYLSVKKGVFKNLGMTIKEIKNHQSE